MGTYDENFSEKLRRHGIDDADRINQILNLSVGDQKAILEHLGWLMFSAQNYYNITLGRGAVAKIDSEWLRLHLEWLIKPSLGAEDYWEYAQVGLFLKDFDHSAYREHLGKCKSHPDSEIRSIYFDKFPEIS